MIIGDEYTIIRAVAGTLPDLIRGESLLAVPAAIKRLQRSHDRARSGAARGHGQIVTRLRALPEDALDAIFDPDPRVFRVVTLEEIALAIEDAWREAAAKGIPLTSFGAEYAGAAKRFDAAIWVGYDQNIPRWAAEGQGLVGVHWRRVSELASPSPESGQHGLSL